MKPSPFAFVLGFLLVLSYQTYAQEGDETPPISASQSGTTLYKNKQNTANVRFISLLQFWARTAEMNPGSVYKNKAVSSLTDFSLRRANLVFIAQLSPRFLLLFDIGGSANAAGGADQTGLSVDITDAYGEYKISDALFVGAGLNQWTGFSRINLDGVGSLLNLDAPRFQYATFNKWDKNGRQLGIYLKGRIAKANYRFMVAEPFSPAYSPSPANTGHGSPGGASLGDVAGNAQVNVGYLNPDASGKLVQGYVQWEFLEKESNVTPYETSLYFGQKRLFNLGTGFMYRDKGILTPTRIEARNTDSPVSETNPVIVKSADSKAFTAFAIDAFLNYRLNQRLEGITAYAGYFNVDLGKNYFTVAGVNNLASATANASAINGAGNAFAATGTGQTVYTQLGYIAPTNFLKSEHRYGVFATYQHSRFEALADPVQVYEAGLNWFLTGNMAKVTLQYRNRPVFNGLANSAQEGSAQVGDRKSEWTLQLQLNF